MVKYLCIGLATAASVAISIAAPAADLSMTPIYRSAPAAVPAGLVIASNRAIQYLQTCARDDQTEGCPGHAQTDRLAVVRGTPDGVFYYHGSIGSTAAGEGTGAAAER
jgi:hypothetical protein